MIKFYKHNVFDSFTNQINVIEIDITDQVIQAEFKAKKLFIKQHLETALSNDELKQNKNNYLQLEYLIVQLYEPNNNETLIKKILKFKPYLIGLKQYDEVLFELQCMPENNVTVGDIKITE